MSEKDKVTELRALRGKATPVCSPLGARRLIGWDANAYALRRLEAHGDEGTRPSGLSGRDPTIQETAPGRR